MHRKEICTKKETSAEPPVRATPRDDTGGGQSQSGGGGKGGALPVYSEDEPVTIEEK